VSTNKKIGVLGASNVDITGFTDNKLIYGDANIGHSKTSAGGVGRNIAENLLRLDFNINLVSVFGDDPLSDYLIKSCKDLGLNINNSLILKNENAGTFIAIMDEHNDLALGISAMDIYKKVNFDLINTKINSFRKLDYIVLETNFPADVLELIVKELPKARFVLDTVSGKKSLRAKKILSNLYILKTNLLEAQMLSNINVKDKESEKKIIQYFLDKGVKKVFITLGKEGVIYGDATTIAHHKTIPTTINNTIGAGDSFVSGIIYADVIGEKINEMALYGMASASINVQYDGAVSPKMNITNLENLIALNKK
jgi:pseudouridine kinase